MPEIAEQTPAPEKKEAPDLLQSRTNFFIDELARVEELQDKRYHYLVTELNLLKRNKKSFDEEDPTRMLGGLFLFIFAIQVVVPLIETMVTKWRSQSS